MSQYPHFVAEYIEYGPTHRFDQIQFKVSLDSCTDVENITYGFMKVLIYPQLSIVIDCLQSPAFSIFIVISIYYFSIGTF